jgi:hypothetical protein
MNALIDLKRLFEKHNIKVTDFDGARLNTKKYGKWGLAFGEFRQNGEVRSRKEIEAIVANVS